VYRKIISFQKYWFVIDFIHFFLSRHSSHEGVEEWYLAEILRNAVGRRQVIAIVEAVRSVLGGHGGRLA
jgi:hypothetical protein